MVPSQAEEEEEETLQAKAASDHTPTAGATTHANIQFSKGGGQPLPTNQRTFFESNMGRDFSSVRIHIDSKAADTARSINARAFTLGQDVVFGAGEYSSGSSSGRRLLAHELTHVVQQSTNKNNIVRRKSPKTAAKLLTKENIANMISLHIIDYREQVKSGIRNWSPPKEESSGVWFLVALAGNMAWAATSFLNPAAAIVIRAISLAGSVIGSGTMEKVLRDEAKTTDIKPMVINQVSAYVDKLKSNINDIVDGVHALLRIRHKLNPVSGWLDADRKVMKRRQLAWRFIFDDSVAPWNNSTAIINNTTDDVAAIYKRFDTLYKAIVLSIYSYPRYKGEKLKEEVETIYYRAFVESGVADRSVAVKKSKAWVVSPRSTYEVKQYEFPAPSPGMTGARVSVPTGREAFDIEVE